MFTDISFFFTFDRETKTSCSPSSGNVDTTGPTNGIALISVSSRILGDRVKRTSTGPENCTDLLFYNSLTIYFSIKNMLYKCNVMFVCSICNFMLLFLARSQKRLFQVHIAYIQLILCQNICRKIHQPTSQKIFSFYRIVAET